MNTINKIKRLLHSCKVALMNPKSFAGVLLEFGEDALKRHVIKQYNCPNGLRTIDLLDLFDNFDETIFPYGFLDGGSSVIDLALLKALARKYEKCRYLEIGTWRGESVANLAAVSEECVSISLSDDEMRKVGWSDDVIRTARFFSIDLKNVIHIGCNSQQFNFNSFNNKFDLIFIDGDHSYEGVKTDTENAFRLLRNSSSVIVWHDYARSPERDINWAVLAGILQGCPVDKKQHLYHVSNTLCAIYIQGDFKTSFVNFPLLPNKTFSIRVTCCKEL